jgi:hypothetical protein
VGEAVAILRWAKQSPSFGREAVARRYRALAGEQIALLEDATRSRSAHRRFLAWLCFRRIASGQQNMAAQRWAAVPRLNALRIERGWRLMRAGRGHARPISPVAASPRWMRSPPAAI